MAHQPQWTVVLVRPGEDQLALLADLSARRNARIAAVYDPEGLSVGAALAGAMGVRVIGDLVELEKGEAEYLVHPPRDGLNAPVIDRAPDFGLEAVEAAEFPALLAGGLLHRLPPPLPARTEDEDPATVEQETAAIHRTLSRIEEALDGESLLRWLLGLATRAAGGSSGSVMLFDDASEELYVAFAYGLSQHTLHRTRVRLGEGIAGRVAQGREPERIDGDRHQGRRRDRTALQTAVCCPVTWEGVLLGVLSVSCDEGENPLEDTALETLEALSHRFGRILDRFLRLQAVVNGETFRELDENFSLAREGSPELGEVLNIWLEDLNRACRSDGIRLTLPTIDGELLVADGSRLSYPPASSSGVAEILINGHPRVQVPRESRETDSDDGSTLFHLPVGRDPVKAVLTARFPNPAAAHHFHRIGGEILYLLNKHLGALMETSRLRDEVRRLTALAAVLGEIRLDGDPEAPLYEERILSAARTLTGAQQAFLLFGPLVREDGVSLTNTDQRLLEVAEDLLGQAVERGHQASVMTLVRDPELGMPRSVMAVPLVAGQTYPGLVLIDKKRLYPADGKSFSEFDASFARRLAPFFRVRPARPAGTVPVPALPSRPEVVEILPADPAPAPAPPAPAIERPFEEILRREMDRCDRYHNMLGLVGFRCDPDEVPVSGIPGLVGGLDNRLRSSDVVGCLEDGTILIMVPEDIQSLPRLRNRVAELLQELAGGLKLKIESATRVYPGGGDTARGMLDTLIESLH